MSRVLLQMSGAPGAGKSTIARAVAARLGWVVVDHDAVKTAVLDGGTGFEAAGRIAYSVTLTVAGGLLEQGWSVVIDSPCFYQQLLDAGQALADRHGAIYRYVECRLDDIDALDARLARRTPMRSQRARVASRPPDQDPAAATEGRQLFRTWIDGMKRPPHDFLACDTSRPLEECLAEVTAYLNSGPEGTPHDGPR